MNGSRAGGAPERGGSGRLSYRAAGLAHRGAEIYRATVARLPTLRSRQPGHVPRSF